ncbi:Acetyltransferase (GNAT) family protein [Modestobacter sp. DSM 44400]|uniref:GNAT family N-acetyltransferase n=1 Tax=Modestobacter sp. DSM 44400 TaxID=1550230 RepID=UPI000897BDEE|nr:GNAT family N-acetyltransferase [Modestobacter sp. DSM 44400]SDY08465.1 Acetyltransferase (GNAT) family protein [Modestobacter sp. DSM 44400]
MTGVRAAAATDLPGLDEALGAPPGVHRSLFARHEAGEAVLFLAFGEDGCPVGSGLLRWRAREDVVRTAFPGAPELSNLQVSPAARGRGSGSALIEAIAARAASAGCPTLGLAVGDENPGAARLYLRLGFTENGLRYVDRYSWTDLTGEAHDEADPVRYLVRYLR